MEENACAITKFTDHTINHFFSIFLYFNSHVLLKYYTYIYNMYFNLNSYCKKIFGKIFYSCHARIEPLIVEQMTDRLLIQRLQWEIKKK